MEVVMSFTYRPSYPRRKSVGYPVDRRLGGPQRRSGCGGEDKKSLPLPGIKPRTSSPYPSHCTDWAILTPYFQRKRSRNSLGIMLDGQSGGGAGKKNFDAWIWNTITETMRNFEAPSNQFKVDKDLHWSNKFFSKNNFDNENNYRIL